jgi:molybdenum cofactor guanylyltransferase
VREGSVRVPVRPASPAPGGRLTEVTGVVLAGGRSTRFGTDKLRHRVEGVPLLQHPVTRLAEACGDVIVVLAPGAEVPLFPPGLPVRVAHDANEGEGPLAGLAAGLAAVSTDIALVAAGDMPRLAPPVLEEMLRVASAAPVDGVALQDGASFRPLPCVLRTTVAQTHAHALLHRGERSLRALLSSLRIAVIDEATWAALDPSRGSLLDVDAPEDLR